MAADLSRVDARDLASKLGIRRFLLFGDCILPGGVCLSVPNWPCPKNDDCCDPDNYVCGLDLGENPIASANVETCFPRCQANNPVGCP